MVPMKKLLSIALALVLCLALCVPAFAATPDLGSFTDKIEEIKASLGDFDTAKSQKRSAISIWTPSRTP